MFVFVISVKVCLPAASDRVNVADNRNLFTVSNGFDVNEESKVHVVTMAAFVCAISNEVRRNQFCFIALKCSFK